MLSVVIPTRNRADLLAPALDSLTRQTLVPEAFEVLVIDNGSTDATAATTQEFVTRLGNLRYFYEPEPGLHVGRHRGMLEARGNVLVFADDDIEALPSWLAAIQEAFSDPKVAMCGGNNLPLFLEPPPEWLKRWWARPALGGRAISCLSVIELPGGIRPFSPLHVWGCNFSIRKDVLLAAGGFHPDGMPRELIRFRGDGETHVSEYVVNSRMTCLFHPGASVYHKVTPERMSFAYFRQRGFNQGVSDSFTALRKDRVSNAGVRHGLLRRIAGTGWQLFKAVSARIAVARSAEEKQALLEMAAGHREGYAYHQQMYREDAEVRTWVHKPRYFEEATNHV